MPQFSFKIKAQFYFCESSNYLPNWNRETGHRERTVKTWSLSGLLQGLASMDPDEFRNKSAGQRVQSSLELCCLGFTSCNFFVHMKPYFNFISRRLWPVLCRRSVLFSPQHSAHDTIIKSCECLSHTSLFWYFLNIGKDTTLQKVHG